MTGGVLRKAREIIMAKPEGERSLHARRLFNLLLYKSMTSASRPSGGVEKARVSELLGYVGGQRLGRLEEALRELSEASMTLEYVDEDGVSHVSRVHYLSFHLTRSEDGWVHYAFDPLMLRFVHDPKVYALMSLSELQAFTRPVAKTLYEIMSLRVRLRTGREWEVGVDEFRARMEIGDSEHARFDSLRQRVIEPAVDEVNEIAPFRIDVSYSRGGRGGRVTAIVFTPGPKGLASLSARDAAAGLAGTRRSPSSPQGLEDDLFGMTEAEARWGITSEAFEEAGRLLSGRDPAPWLDEWAERTKGRRPRRPDRSFLSWLEARIAAEGGEDIPEGLEDVVASWVEGAQ